VGGQKLMDALAGKNFEWLKAATEVGETIPFFAREINETSGLSLLLRGKDGWWVVQATADELALISK
jgi:hypothetical protein